jgi:hypothetical protein
MVRQNKAEMKIQQMAFMILAVFFFFILVGLFFISWQFKDTKSSFEELKREQAISALKTLASLPEFSCESSELCLDEDKLIVMANKKEYRTFWQVSSIKAYKIVTNSSQKIKCPSSDCNYYEIFSSGNINVEEYSTYVNICKKISESGYVYDSCEVGKLVVGVKLANG